MANTSPNNSWFAYYRANPASDLRLFCFPYAGGSALTYRSWSELLPKNVEVCPIELPGRGSRLREAPYTSLALLVTDSAAALTRYLDKPYAFFGHSMGALIGFELARLFRQQSLPEPLHLFASGHTAPQVSSGHRPIYNLPENEFMEELRKLNGTPDAVLNNEELMKLLLPMLRADFAVNETYIYQPDLPLDCPISAYGGVQDKDVNRESLEAWREQTAAAFSLQMFAGGHFFLQTSPTLLLQTISFQLKKIVAGLLSQREA